MSITISSINMPQGCQKCKFFKKHAFGNGLDYSYSCILGAKDFPMPWIRQMEERASDCPIEPLEQETWDCISRQAVFDIVEKEIFKDDALSKIEKLPSVNPQEPKTGRWEETRYRSYDLQSCETYDDGMGFRCSNCANVFKVTSLARYHYCPNCGAKMESEG